MRRTESIPDPVTTQDCPKNRAALEKAILEISRVLLQTNRLGREREHGFNCNVQVGSNLHQTSISSRRRASLDRFAHLCDDTLHPRLAVQAGPAHEGIRSDARTFGSGGEVDSAIYFQTKVKVAL